MLDEKYTRCPTCGRKGVYLRLRPNGEDHYRCRYSRLGCEFWFYTDGHYEDDRENEARWRVTNGMPPEQARDL